jgi:ubiquitin-conjugating enzyme E2 J2
MTDNFHRKRVLSEFNTVRKNPIPHVTFIMDPHDVDTWYFMFIGPPASEYQGGHYLGKIMYGPEYPLKPFTVQMLTPNGVLNINQKCCLFGARENDWSPTWCTSAIINSCLLMFMNVPETPLSPTEIQQLELYGYVITTPAEREVFAAQSIKYNQKYYGALYQAMRSNDLSV